MTKMEASREGQPGLSLLPPSPLTAGEVLSTWSNMAAPAPVTVPSCQPIGGEERKGAGMYISRNKPETTLSISDHI